MKKITVKEPVFETIQTGEKEVEKWQTSDGREFEERDRAEDHEFFNLKLNRRGLPEEFYQGVTILDFNNFQEFKRYEEAYIRNKKGYDTKNLIFPNTYVFYELDLVERDEDNMYDYPEWCTYCVTSNEYINMMEEELK